MNTEVKRRRLESINFFDNLPPDSLEIIIKKNSIDEPNYFCSLSLVSKLFHQLATTLLIREQNKSGDILFNEPSDSQPHFSERFQVNFTINNKDRITKLSVHFFSYESLQIYRIYEMINQLSNLKDLAVWDETDSFDWNQVEKLESLTSLGVSNLDAEEIQDVGKKFPNLNECDFGATTLAGCTFFEAVADYYPNLTNLAVMPHDFVDDSGEVNNQEVTTSKFLSQNVYIFEKIKELHLDASQLQKVAIVDIVDSFPGLINLTVEGSLNSENIPEGLKKIKSLKYLYLCSPISEKGLQNIVYLFPNIIELTLSSPNLGDLASTKIVASLSKLCFLRFLTLRKKYESCSLENLLPNVSIDYYLF